MPNTATQNPAKTDKHGSTRPKGSILEAQFATPLIRATQLVIIWLLLKPIRHFYLRRLDNGLNLPELRVGTKYIIALNHQSMLDPFILAASLPFAVWQRIAPIRFFAHTVFFTQWFTYPWMIAMGCFPARRHETLPYGLELAERLIGKKNTIAIFPEGQRALPGEVFAKHGVAVLAKLPGIEVIPVHLQWTAGSPLTRRLRMTIGTPRDCSQMTAQEILHAIYALPLPS
jgi:1-acyl-sn-glycerol-3-phosphate acyltransferase